MPQAVECYHLTIEDISEQLIEREEAEAADFDAVNEGSDLKWSFKSQLGKVSQK